MFEKQRLTYSTELLVESAVGCSGGERTVKASDCAPASVVIIGHETGQVHIPVSIHMMIVWCEGGG